MAFESLLLHYSHFWHIFTKALFFLLCRFAFSHFLIDSLEFFGVELLLDWLQLLLGLGCLVGEVVSFDLEIYHGLCIIQ